VDCDVLEDDLGVRRGRLRLLGIAHHGLAIDELEDASAGGEDPRELARSGLQRCDAVERRQREQGERGDEDAVERARIVGLDPDREHANHGQVGPEDRHGVPKTGSERFAPAEAGELAVQRLDALERRLLAPVDDELRRAPEQLDQLGGQLRARRCTAARGCPLHGGGQERHDDSDGDEACGEDRRREGQERRRDRHAPSTDDQRDERRPEPAYVETLERIDVANEPAEQLAAPEALELGRSQRLDPLVDARADPAETP
jgi:hypothetical protein